jgi:uncharacterized membrane protein YfcA
VTESFVVSTTLVFLLAGMVKGVIGMGLPTLAIALLGLYLPPTQAASLMVVPSLVTNVWQALAGSHTRALLRRLWTMLAAICVGTWIGSHGAMGLGDPGRAAAALGAALMVYAAVGLFARPFEVSPRSERLLSPPVGLLTGFVSAATGVFVMPSVPYLQSMKLSRDELVQGLGLTFTVATLALGASLMKLGHLDAATAGVSSLALIPALLGMACGQRLRKRVSIATFRICFFIGTLLLGAHLALRPFL